MAKKLLSVLLACIFIVYAALPASAYKEYEMKYALGDVDQSDDVTASDALLALQCAVGKISLDYTEQDSADVNQDWVITAADALMVLQKAVGKIELSLKENVYETYELKYVEPVDLEEGTVYIVNSSALNVRDFDFVRLFVAIQGLINRNVSEHGVGVYTMTDDTDSFWFDYITADGMTFDYMTTCNIRTVDEFFEIFLPFIEECGMVVWDPAVPATSNVAATICGLENYLPVKYDTSDGSLYNKLIDFGVEEKMSLVGMFGDVKLGSKIVDTDINSTGSAKCDAYIWAMEKYLDRCNPEFIAYTLDGAPTIDGNPVRDTNPDNTWGATVIGLTNQDYFVLKQCFFMDFTSYDAEQPSDDPTQPLGTDKDTLIKLLKLRYEMAGGQYGVVLGFPPWHVKYTNHLQIGGSLAGATLEWHFVETCTAFNCAIEADAAHPCWMTNASLYTNFEMTVEPEGNTPADETVEYDENTRYYAMAFSGDFDCSPWMKAYVPGVWQDKNRGSVHMTYSYNLNLVERIPMAFNYVWENKSDYDYFAAGEGFGYSMPYMLFKGNTGNQPSPTTRTMTDGDRAFLHYAKPYYDFFKVDTITRLLDSHMSTDVYELLNVIAPGGSMMYWYPAQATLGQYNGVPYTVMADGFCSGDTPENKAINMKAGFKKDQQFVTFSYGDNGKSYGTPSSMKEVNDAFQEYVSWKDPEHKYEFVSVSTLMKLLMESGKAEDLAEINKNLQ